MHVGAFAKNGTQVKLAPLVVKWSTQVKSQQPFLYRWMILWGGSLFRPQSQTCEKGTSVSFCGLWKGLGLFALVTVFLVNLKMLFGVLIAVGGLAAVFSPLFLPCSLPLSFFFFPFFDSAQISVWPSAHTSYRRLLINPITGASAPLDRALLGNPSWGSYRLHNSAAIWGWRSWRMLGDSALAPGEYKWPESCCYFLGDIVLIVLFSFLPSFLSF